MGGRQSSQNNHRQHSPSQGSSRYSTSSLDNGGNDHGLISGPSGSIDLSIERPVSRRRRRRDRNDQFIEAHSLPAHLFPFVTAEIKCPVCNKRIGTNEIEPHLLACLAKPRVSYNEDVLKADAGECIICFEDMVTGEHIARLPCLCIYHKKCLDEWFNRNRCCPAHPDQIPQEYTDSSVGSSSTTMDNTNESTENNENNTALTSENPSSLGSEQAVAVAIAGATPVASTVENNEQTEEIFPIIPHLELDTSNLNDNYMNMTIPSETSHINVSPSSSPSPPDAITPADDYSRSSRSSQRAIGKTVVHVDDGSMHGSPSLFDEDEIAQLASKIKTILVQESPRTREFDET